MAHSDARPRRMCRCRECGATYPQGKKRSDFCSKECRRDFNNRRAKRGVEIYDLAMELRFDRDRAQEDGTWSLFCNCLSRFNDEDRKAGRKSWSLSRRMKNVNSRLGR